MKLTEGLKERVALWLVAVCVSFIVGCVVQIVLLYVVLSQSAATHQVTDANWTLFISIPSALVAAALAVFVMNALKARM